MARRCTSEQQACDVRAHDQQNETHCAKKSEEYGTHRAGNLFAEGDYIRPDSGVGIRIELREALRDAIHFLLRLRLRRIRFEPSDDEQIVASVIGQILGSQCDGHPELVVWIWKMKIRRHDADDGIAFSVEQNRFSQNLQV